MSDEESLPHARAFELLPWLANGSLAATEREAVEVHVRSCIACRREIREQRRLLAAFRTQPAVHLSAQLGFEHLTDRLAATERERAVASAHGYAPLFRFATVAAMGVALLAFLLWLAPSPSGPSGAYSTLATEPAARGAQLDVIFGETTTAAEMQQLLDEIGGSIVAGPNAVGRYRVRVANGGASAAELERVLERVAADPNVRFAGRAFADIPP